MTYVHIKTCAQMCIAALFVTVKKIKNSLNVHQQLKRKTLCYTNRMTTIHQEKKQSITYMQKNKSQKNYAE